jgi:cytoskeletal protein RodZ
MKNLDRFERHNKKLAPKHQRQHSFSLPLLLSKFASMALLLVLLFISLGHRAKVYSATSCNSSSRIIGPSVVSFATALAPQSVIPTRAMRHSQLQKHQQYTIVKARCLSIRTFPLLQPIPGGSQLRNQMSKPPSLNSVASDAATTDSIRDDDDDSLHSATMASKSLHKNVIHHATDAAVATGAKKQAAALDATSFRAPNTLTSGDETLDIEPLTLDINSAVTFQDNKDTSPTAGQADTSAPNPPHLHEYIWNSALGECKLNFTAHEWAQYATDLTNARVGSIANDVVVDKVYLQQYVFPVIAYLLRSFAPNADWYKAAELVDCAYLVHTTDTAQSPSRAAYTPDSALVVPLGLDLTIGLFQVQALDATDDAKEMDVFKASVITSMALLALEQLGCGHDIAIPFVVAIHNKASLYATRFDGDSNGANNPGVIVIDKICSDVAFDNDTLEATEDKVRFIVTLALLLSKIVGAVKGNMEAVTRTGAAATARSDVHRDISNAFDEAGNVSRQETKVNGSDN